MKVTLVAKRRPINPLSISPLLLVIVFALICGGLGFAYVTLKYRQHAIGEEIRDLERQLSDVRTYNKEAAQRITHLSSRLTLRQRVDTGFIAMVPIQNPNITRLQVPAPSLEDGIFRTAVSHGASQ